MGKGGHLIFRAKELWFCGFRRIALYTIGVYTFWSDAGGTGRRGAIIEVIGFARGGGMGMFGGTDVGISKIGVTNRGMDSMRGVGGSTRAAIIVKLGEGGYLTKCEGSSVET